MKATQNAERHYNSYDHLARAKGPTLRAAKQRKSADFVKFKILLARDCHWQVSNKKNVDICREHAQILRISLIILVPDGLSAMQNRKVWKISGPCVIQTHMSTAIPRNVFLLADLNQFFEYMIFIFQLLKSNQVWGSSIQPFSWLQRYKNIKSFTWSRVGPSPLHMIWQNTKFVLRQLHEM